MFNIRDTQVRFIGLLFIKKHFFPLLKKNISLWVDLDQFVEKFNTIANKFFVSNLFWLEIDIDWRNLKLMYWLQFRHIILFKNKLNYQYYMRNTKNCLERIPLIHFLIIHLMIMILNNKKVRNLYLIQSTIFNKTSLLQCKIILLKILQKISFNIWSYMLELLFTFQKERCVFFGMHDDRGQKKITIENQYPLLLSFINLIEQRFTIFCFSLRFIFMKLTT